MNYFKPFIKRIAEGHILSSTEAEIAFSFLLENKVTPSQIGAFLMGLQIRGVDIVELVAGAKIIRQHALKVEYPDTIDTCGTGGDGINTYNISTAVSFVLAGCGVAVAKHGSRAVSSKSGSSDIIKSLGVNLDLTPQQISVCIKECNIGFMFAPAHHDAMRHVAPIRAQLGIKSVFNLLGPLSNPANAQYQLLGVFSSEWVEPIANVLHQLGSKTAWVVHGHDGLDELTTTTETTVAELKNGQIRLFEVSPEDAGLKRNSIESLQGDTVEFNANALSRLLDGQDSAYRDIVLLNTAAALIIKDKVKTLKQGVELARASIDEGCAQLALNKLIRISQKYA